MARRATAQDVANLAGVSRSSVSLVLNGHGDGNIAPAKQAAIIDAARQLGYRPNTLALSLRNRRTRTLGVLTWQGESGFPEVLLHAGGETATAAGYLSILMDTANDPVVEARAVTTMLDRQVDAIVVVSPELVDYHPSELLADTPTVLINCTDPEGRTSSVTPDEFGAAQCATNILINHGHRRIALLTDDAPTAQIQARVAGVHSAARLAGITPSVLVADRPDIQQGARLTREALTAPQPPTGLVTTRERLALGAVLAATDLQVAIPGALSVISLEDGERLAPNLVPPLATMQRPDRAMAEQALAVLLRELTSEDGDGKVRHLSFACPPDLRGSTGPAPPA